MAETTAKETVAINKRSTYEHSVESLVLSSSASLKAQDVSQDIEPNPKDWQTFKNLSLAIPLLDIKALCWCHTGDSSTRSGGFAVLQS